MPTIYLKVKVDITGSSYETPQENLSSLFNEGRLVLQIEKQDESLPGGVIGLHVSSEKIDQGDLKIENQEKDVRISIAAVLKFVVQGKYTEVFLNPDTPFLFGGGTWDNGQLDKNTIRGLEYFERTEKRRNGDVKVKYYIFPCEASNKKLKL